MDELDPEIAALLDNVEQIDDLPALDDKTQFKKKTLFEVSEEDLLIKKKQSPNLQIRLQILFLTIHHIIKQHLLVKMNMHSEFISCFQNI